MSAQSPFFAPVPNPPPGYNVEWANRVVTSLNVAMAKINNGALLTLAAGTTTTNMIDARLSAFSVLTFMPLTANAAAIASSIWVSNRGKGRALINHANTANVDQDFAIGIHA